MQKIPTKKSSKFVWDLSKTPPFFVWNTIKSLRERRGEKQIDVAFGAKISLGTLVFLEAGFDSGTRDEVKRKLSVYFGVPVDAIFPVERIGAISKREYLAKKISEDLKKSGVSFESKAKEV